MKPKAGTSTKVKKTTSNILKPAVSAATIRKTLKNVIEKNLLNEATSGARSVRSNRRAAHDVPRGKPVKDAAVSNRRGIKNKLEVPNDHEAPGSSQSLQKAEMSKRQKISLMEVPKLPTTQGSVFVFGANDCGQLGFGDDVAEKIRPVELRLKGIPIVNIAAGAMHSVCLASNGEVYTFGCNDDGALGRPTDDDSEASPVKVVLPEVIVMISAGDSHTAALSETGKVYLWGSFRNGQGHMGLTPDGEKQASPIRILEYVQIVKIASGGDHLVCLSAEGHVYTCGCAESGQLGRITPRSASDGGRTGGLGALLIPDIVRVAGKPRRFDNIWAGSYTTFMREKNTDHIYAFGLNNHYQLGYDNKNREIARYAPKHVTFPNRTQIICGGQHHTLSLDDNGHIYVVGRKEYGRLGLGQNSEDAKEPTLIRSLGNEKCCDVSCGNCVSFAVNTNGNVYSWGMGDGHQLGHGSEDDCFVPTMIQGDFKSQHAFKVAGGGQHTLILAQDRTKMIK